MTLSNCSRSVVTIELKSLAYVAKLPRLTWLRKSCSHGSIRQTIAQRCIIGMLSRHK